jgi:hypothetical protein
MQWFFDNLAGGVAYDLFKYYVLGPLIVAILSTTILRYAFQKLHERREQIVFFVGIFAVFVVLFFFVGTKPQQPNLIGTIQQVAAGQTAPNSRDTIAIITIGIVNTGGMQSIVKQWRVQAKSQGNIYEGIIVPMQKNFTFDNIPKITEDQPESVTYKAEDDIVQKGLSPIQTGAFLQGIMFSLFRNVDGSVFKGPMEYEVSYEDALSRKYIMPAKYSGQMGVFPATPGLHTEAVCRQGSWPLPDVTGSLPSGRLPQLNDLPSHNYSPVPAKRS